MKSERVFFFFSSETPSHHFRSPFPPSSFSPPSASSLHFLQPTNQASEFNICFRECRTVAFKWGWRRGSTFPRKKKEETQLDIRRRAFSRGEGPSKSTRLFEIFPCCLRYFSLSRFGLCWCRASYDIEMRASVRFGGRKEAWKRESRAR